MRLLFSVLLVTSLLAPNCAFAQAEITIDSTSPDTSAADSKSAEWPKEEVDSFGILFGPSTESIGNLATIDVPEGYIFIAADGTKKMMEAMENIVSGNELALLGKRDMSWFCVYEFSAIGYVKDDERDKLNADEMFKSLQEGSKEANEERVERGWGTMTPVAWKIEPRYNESTNNLEWAVTYVTENNSYITNYNTRRLGRAGIMNLTVVCNPDSLDSVIPEFLSVMNSFSYVSGQTYAEYKQGDKLYEYGLTALVVGGGAAVAAKAGVFKWLWKVILAGIAVAAGFLKKFFKKEPKAPGTV
ncbi:MAG: DUF2167 domain-containing protein [Candidatus Zixiibacteriota bacterium]